jgi:hypothetical protein
MDGKLVPQAKYPEHDLTQQIAKRAYELYNRRGRQSGHSDQDWLQAEREINLERNPMTKPMQPVSAPPLTS